MVCVHVPPRHLTSLPIYTEHSKQPAVFPRSSAMASLLSVALVFLLQLSTHRKVSQYTLNWADDTLLKRTNAVLDFGVKPVSPRSTLSMYNGYSEDSNFFASYEVRLRKICSLSTLHSIPTADTLALHCNFTCRPQWKINATELEAKRVVRSNAVDAFSVLL
jgi:hypothetical protein